jgi:hypothetical protein
MKRALKRSCPKTTTNAQTRMSALSVAIAVHVKKITKMALANHAQRVLPAHCFRAASLIALPNSEASGPGQRLAIATAMIPRCPHRGTYLSEDELPVP